MWFTNIISSTYHSISFTRYVFSGGQQMAATDGFQPLYEFLDQVLLCVRKSISLHARGRTNNQSCFHHRPGSAFIKRDQPDPCIKDQIKTILLSTISPLQLPNFVSCGRDKPSHMTQNLVTVGTKLWTAERFLVDP